MNKLSSLFFVVLLGSCIGCGSEGKKQPESAQGAPSTHYDRNVSHVIDVEKAEGEQVPNFSWYDDTGKKVSLKEIANGKPVLINFWATWCGPCVREMPDLVELSNEYKSKGGLVIGISVDKDSDVLNLVSEFTKEKNVHYPIVIDNGNLEQAFGGIRGIPTTFYVDKNGRIIKKLVGMRSKEVFAQEFDALL